MEHPQNIAAPSATEISTKSNRLAYLDNLKAFMIIMVVVVHSTLAYSGAGSWYYHEDSTKDISNILFDEISFFDTFNQAYFMSLFFVIAAYFIPHSLAKKGLKKFITDRIVRLGIPTLLYMFMIHPILRKMTNPGINLFDFYLTGIKTLNFFSWTGPMWFALILLIFSIIYAFVNIIFKSHLANIRVSINLKSVSILIALITICAFGIRLIYPIGTSVMKIQLCFFSAYIFMFICGTMAYQNNLFESIDNKTAKKYLVAALGFGIPLWISIVHFWVDENTIQTSPVFGGMNLGALSYSFWESFFCVTFVIALIGLFREHLNTQNSLQKFLSDNTFGVYFLHPLVLVSTSVLLKPEHLSPMLKIIIVACVAVPMSFLVSHLVRKVNIFHKILA